MLKRLLEKLFGRWMKSRTPAASSRQFSAAPADEPAPEPAGSVEPPPANAKELWEREAFKPFDPGNATPEQLCGIVPRMTQEEIRERLAMLYRRHTRAESSPDPALRHEAAFMLDVIAGLREKYLGSALAPLDGEGEG